jgi:hypothetical protein
LHIIITGVIENNREKFYKIRELKQNTSWGCSMVEEHLLEALNSNTRTTGKKKKTQTNQIKLRTLKYI